MTNKPVKPVYIRPQPQQIRPQLQQTRPADSIRTNPLSLLSPTEKAIKAMIPTTFTFNADIFRALNCPFCAKLPISMKSRMKGVEICRSDDQSTMVEIGFYRDHLVTHFISVKPNLVLDTLSKMSFCKECMQMAQRHFLLGDKQKAWTDFPFIFFDDQGRLI